MANIFNRFGGAVRAQRDERIARSNELKASGQSVSPTSGRTLAETRAQGGIMQGQYVDPSAAGQPAGTPTEGYGPIFGQAAQVLTAPSVYRTDASGKEVDAQGNAVTRNPQGAITTAPTAPAPADRRVIAGQAGLGNMGADMMQVDPATGAERRSAFEQRFGRGMQGVYSHDTGNFAAPDDRRAQRTREWAASRGIPSMSQAGTDLYERQQAGDMQTLQLRPGQGGGGMSNPVLRPGQGGGGLQNVAAGIIDNRPAAGAGFNDSRLGQAGFNELARSVADGPTPQDRWGQYIQNSGGQMPNLSGRGDSGGLAGNAAAEVLGAANALRGRREVNRLGRIERETDQQLFERTISEGNLEANLGNARAQLINAQKVTPGKNDGTIKFNPPKADFTGRMPERGTIQFGDTEIDATQEQMDGIKETTRELLSLNPDLTEQQALFQAFTRFLRGLDNKQE